MSRNNPISATESPSPNLLHCSPPSTYPSRSPCLHVQHTVSLSTTFDPPTTKSRHGRPRSQRPPFQASRVCEHSRCTLGLKAVFPKSLTRTHHPFHRSHARIANHNGGKRAECWTLRPLGLILARESLLRLSDAPPCRRFGWPRCEERAPRRLLMGRLIFRAALHTAQEMFRVLWSRVEMGSTMVAR